MARTIKVTLGFDGANTTFDLKMIRMHEEAAFYAKFTDNASLPDAEKADASMQICIDAIAEWSVKAPTNAKGKPVNDEKTPAASVKKLFTDADPVEAERIANAIINEHSKGLVPDVVF